MSMSNQNLRWHTLKEGKWIMLNDLDYLNFLLEQSRQAVKSFDKDKILWLKYDLEEFNEAESMIKTSFQTIINAELNTLKRVLKYESFTSSQSTSTRFSQHLQNIQNILNNSDQETNH